MCRSFHVFLIFPKYVPFIVKMGERPHFVELLEPRGPMENTKPHTAAFFLAVTVLLAILGEAIYAVGRYLLR